MVSLTLGGYDAAMFVSTPITFDMIFNPDLRGLIVNLTSIEYRSSTPRQSIPLLTSAMTVLVDSQAVDMWLPLDVCSRFEQAFDLSYDSAINRYIIDRSSHQVLQNSTASVVFTLRGREGALVDITLPYASFDLKLSSPIVNTTAYYFPLRRSNSTYQMDLILGRTFLQEAWVVELGQGKCSR